MSTNSSFFSHLNFTLFTVDNIYHSQNFSSNCNETLTVTCFSQRRDGRISLRFQTLRPSSDVKLFMVESNVNDLSSLFELICIRFDT